MIEDVHIGANGAERKVCYRSKLGLYSVAEGCGGTCEGSVSSEADVLDGELVAGEGVSLRAVAFCGDGWAEGLAGVSFLERGVG